MIKWITFPKIEGISSRQAHTDLPTGTYERELGKEGFFGPATQMYHRHPPTAWLDIEGPLRPHAFDTLKLTTTMDSPWLSPILLYNPDTQIRYWQCSQSMTRLVRNADGDQLLFIHQGAGELYCDYGHLSFHDGDYILLPRGTMWRLEIHEGCSVLMIEARGQHFGLPEKGMLGHHAVFDPAILQTPKIDEAFKAQQNDDEYSVEIKRHDEQSIMRYPFNPLDAIGWHGDLTVVKLNWRDIRPVMSHRYHVPPSAHTTFLSRNFVVCTFCPRPIESDPGALKVPFYHSNDDFDEVIFYHRGEFFSRDNIHPGMMSLHPSGLPHGPHPKAFAKGEKHERKETDEVAVMIDTKHALNISKQAEHIEWKDYVHSWKVKDEA